MITVATSASTSSSTIAAGSPGLVSSQLQEQIRKVRGLRQNLKMNIEPSRIPGEDELYVGGYVPFSYSQALALCT